MNTGKENYNLIDSTKEREKHQNIEWDNGDPTYGHAIKPSSFKKKDEPNEEHLKSAEQIKKPKIIEDLKNAGLSEDSDIGNRNSEQDKGIGGLSL